MVVTVGVTDTVAVVAAVGSSHKYVNGAPPVALALSVDELPTHITVGAAEGAPPTGNTVTDTGPEVEEHNVFGSCAVTV